MARKNLLSGLMGEAMPPEKAAIGREQGRSDDPAAASAAPVPAPGTSRVDPSRPRYAGGAIGAVSQSIADLRARAVIDIDTAMIDAGGLRDRIEESRDDHEALKASIRDYGLQVPLLVRPAPGAPGRYQIVYGRRRLAALEALGLPARAMVRDLDDTGVVMAQGQENSARRDLSFIEKCNFARQMRDAGYDRKAIGDALAIDKTLISRMFSVADSVPTELMEAIGSAPNVGRDRWVALAALLTAEGDAPLDVSTLVLLTAVNPVPDPGETASDARFAIVHDHLTRAAGTAPAPRRVRTKNVRGKVQTLKTDAGFPLARITRNPERLTFVIPADTGFPDWLAERLPEIYRDWMKKKPRGE